MDRVTAAHAAHHGGIEPRCLYQHVPGLRRDHGLPAAHHPGQPERLDLIRHNQIVGIEYAVHTIQRFQALPRASAADEDCTLNPV